MKQAFHAFRWIRMCSKYAILHCHPRIKSRRVINPNLGNLEWISFLPDIDSLGVVKGDQHAVLIEF